MAICCLILIRFWIFRPWIQWLLLGRVRGQVGALLGRQFPVQSFVYWTNTNGNSASKFGLCLVGFELNDERAASITERWVQGKVHTTILGQKEQFYTTNQHFEQGEIMYTLEVNYGLERVVETMAVPRKTPSLQHCYEGRFCNSLGYPRKDWGNLHRRLVLIVQRYRTSQIGAHNEMEMQRFHTNQGIPSPQQHVCLWLGTFAVDIKLNNRCTDE